MAQEVEQRINAEDPLNISEVFVTHVEPFAAANSCVFVTLCCDRPEIDHKTNSAVSKRIVVSRLVFTAAALEKFANCMAGLANTVAAVNAPAAGGTKPN